MSEERGVSGLKPPEHLKNLTGEEFKRWKQRFEIYRIASGANKKQDDIQIALLLHCIGEQCIEIYNTFNLDKPCYDTVMGKFTEYFIPMKNESVSSHIFFLRNQNDNEGIDQYVTELKKLAEDCDFGNLKERLIRDRIVSGIKDKVIKDRLLRESDLTLNKAIHICKAAEISSKQLRQIEENVENINLVKKQGRNKYTKQIQKKHNTSPSHGQTTSKGSTHTFMKKQECSRCGYNHIKTNCPAYGKTCMKCKKIGHFAKMCKSTNIKYLKISEENKEEDDLYMSEVKINSINSVDSNWFEQVKFLDKNKLIKFKLDTGAQCNVLSKKVCDFLQIDNIYKSKLRLTNYSGHKIETLGQVKLKCQIDNKIDNVIFQICVGDFCPILGLPTITYFNLIRRNCHEINKINCSDEIFTKNKDVFNGIGLIKNYEYEIKLKKDYVGKIEACRHIPFKLLPKLKQELLKMENLGIISKIDKPTEFVSSLVMTVKLDGSLRVCLDPQYLNSQIQREQILMPTLQEITSKLSKSSVFSTLDANKGFWQVLLSESSRELTTFNTPMGRYYFNRLPFGLSSSPEIFQKVFTKIFKDIEGVEIYIDDILLHTPCIKSHYILLEKVLQRAKEFGIKFNKSKCVFMVNKVKYLGHILTKDGIQVDSDRTKAIIEMKEPKDRQELLRFLGMVNYVSRFIKNISEITAPLRVLIKKNVPFIWSSEQQKAYDKLKGMLVEPPVLKFFDINKPITLSVDASKSGLGAVILQDKQPVTYGSRAMTELEQTYSQIEKESLAILFGCTKFYQYIYGQKITIETDHKPLVSIFNKPLNKCPARLQKIRMSLQQYDFTLIYKPGKELLVADHLSRSYIKDNSKPYDLDLEAHVGMIVNSIQITDSKMQELIKETEQDLELQCVRNFIRKGWPNNKTEVDSLAKIYFSYKEELNEYNGLILKGTQIIIPKALRANILSKIHYAHLGISKCKALARQTVYWPNMNKQIDDLISNCDTCKKYQIANRSEPMISKEIPDKPWQILATDIFFLKGTPYLLVVDAYSKFVELKKLKDLSSKNTILGLKEIFARHGIPYILYSDSGTQFTSLEFKNFAKHWSFTHTLTSPRHHQSNGLAERHIQTVKRLLKKLAEENKDYYLGLLTYRNTPITEEGKSPAELLFSREVNYTIPKLSKKFIINQDRYRNELKIKQQKQEKYFNHFTRNLPNLETGNVVKIKEENSSGPHKSGIVIGQGKVPRSYVIKNEEGEYIRRNRKDLIKNGRYYDNSRKRDYDYNFNNFEKCNVNKTNDTETNIDNKIENDKPLDNKQFTRSGREIKKPSYFRDYFRLCLVRGRGGFNRPARYCPVLDSENSGIECVLGTDRLDCLRRISKGKVDFGVFSPEDLVAAQWANIDVLVTNELRGRNRSFERSVVAVVNKRIQFDSSSSLHSILKNTTLCHPGVGVEDIRPLSDTISGYLENLVIPRSCDPKLSLAENRIKALADFFGRSCKAGPWVLDSHRDAELKSRYSSLCAACGSPKCSTDDQFWGDVGALGCLLDRGDVAWAELDDVTAYFGLKTRNEAFASAGNFQYLCREGGSQPLEAEDPCVWLHRPWPVLVATRKSAEAVAAIAMSLTNRTVVVDRHWHGALANLLEIHQAQPAPLQPPMVPLDYLARAKGFREAYSQSGCDPPRHVTLCTTSNLQRNKCEWLSEAGAVYGIAPPLQCTIRPDLKSCMEAAEKDEAVVLADSDWLLKGTRDYSLQALLHEVTPIVDQTHTVVAYVKSDSNINKMADLRGKRAFFPEYDGFAWHSVLRYITKKNNVKCKGIKSYFSQICAPGFESANASAAVRDSLTAACYRENGVVLNGEIQALRALVEGKADVAFISIQTYNMYAANILFHYEWAKTPINLKPVCPEENTEYCFISWSSLGHIFAAKNMSAMRKQEIINSFTKLDEHFGKRTTMHLAMFSLYGSFDDNMDVIFHNNSRSLATADILLTHPYNKIPLNFERELSVSTDSCQLVDFTNGGPRIGSSILLLVSLVLYFISS